MFLLHALKLVASKLPVKLALCDRALKVISSGSDFCENSYQRIAKNLRSDVCVDTACIKTLPVSCGCSETNWRLNDALFWISL